MGAVYVGESASGSPHYTGYSTARGEVWYSTTTVFAFYKKTTGNGFVYRKSTDSGLTWGTEVLVCGVSVDYDIYYNRWSNESLDPVVHCVGHVDVTGDRAVHYANVNLSTEAVSAEQSIITSSSNPYAGATSIGVARNGDIHVVYDRLGTARHVISTNGGTSFSNSTDQDYGQYTYDRTYLVPDGSSGDTADMLVFFLQPANPAVSPATATLYVAQWDSSAGLWGAPVTVRSGLTYWNGQAPRYMNLSVAYVKDNGHVMVLVWDTEWTGSNPDYTGNTLYCYDVNGTGSITARTNVIASVDYAMACAAAVMPGAGGSWYAFYARDPAGLDEDDMNVFYKVSTDSGVTWGSEVDYSTAATHAISIIAADPSPTVNKHVPTYQYTSSDISGDPAGSDNDVWIEAGFLEATININVAVTATLTGGGVSSTPPLVIKCKAVDGVGVVNFTTGWRVRE